MESEVIGGKATVILSVRKKIKINTLSFPNYKFATELSAMFVLSKRKKVNDYNCPHTLSLSECFF